jgi:hypothetical protein
LNESEWKHFLIPNFESASDETSFCSEKKWLVNVWYCVGLSYFLTSSLQLFKKSLSTQGSGGCLTKFRTSLYFFRLKALSAILSLSQ